MVDYGNREKLPITCAKELHPECCLLPPQAIECKLQDVDEKDNVELNKKFRDVAQGKGMVMRLSKSDIS